MTVTSKVVALVQRVLKRRGLEVRRLAKEQAAPEVAIDVLALCVADLRARRDDLFFVQIGAHDGLSYDPMRPFVERLRLRGLLVEPQPRVFAQLVENYKEHPQLSFENAAIAQQDGTATLFSFAPAPGLPPHASMLASFRRELLEANGHGYAGPIQSTSVPSLRLPTLLRKHAVERLDILQLDTEGYDFEILKMLDFSTIKPALKPALIHFENNFLSPGESAECSSLLTKHGYRLLTLGIDTIAFQQESTGFDERAAVSALDARSQRL